MQMVKIQIPDKSERTKAFATLIRRGRVICLPADTFIVPEPALDVLKELGVNYVELGRGGHDYAQKALRDSLTSQA
jgi:hypothetical protein